MLHRSRTLPCKSSVSCALNSHCDVVSLMTPPLGCSVVRQPTLLIPKPSFIMLNRTNPTQSSQCPNDPSRHRTNPLNASNKGSAHLAMPRRQSTMPRHNAPTHNVEPARLTVHSHSRTTSTLPSPLAGQCDSLCYAPTLQSWVMLPIAPTMQRLDFGALSQWPIVSFGAVSCCVGT